MQTQPGQGRVLPTELAAVFLGIAGLCANALSKFASNRLVPALAVLGILGCIVALVLAARRRRRPGAILRSVLLSLLAILAGTYALLFPYIYFFQDSIANQSSALFQPKSISTAGAQAFVKGNVEALEVTTGDGVHLRGWLVRNSSASSAPLVIYFGGSGSESSEMLAQAKTLAGRSVALLNYRGFGLSEGTAGHAAVLSDALTIYDTLVQRADVDRSRVVAMGYSLGTGIAVYLAQQRPLDGVVLVSPFDRLTLTGRNRPLIYAPLAGIMHYYFDSLGRAPGIAVPMLCLIGSRDTTIPPEVSRRLVAAWGGPTTVTLYEGENHSLPKHSAQAWSDVATYLNSLDR